MRAVDMGAEVPLLEACAGGELDQNKARSGQAADKARWPLVVGFLVWTQLMQMGGHEHETLICLDTFGHLASCSSSL